MKTMENQVFVYNGNAVTFQLGNGDVMVNATEMAKAFGKLPSGYLRTQSSKDLIQALSARTNRIATDLVSVINGGTNFGTWMHEDVALDFAQWLSIDFKLWCNDRLKELLKHGVTTTSSINDFLENPDALIESLQALKKERAEKERLRVQNEYQIQELKQAAPKVEYFDNVLQSNSTYTTNQIAKELGMSAIGLNRELQDLKIQYKQSDTWMLYSKYQNEGYTKTKTYSYTDSIGKQQTSMQTVWTEKGRKFIHACLDIGSRKSNLQKQLQAFDKV